MPAKEARSCASTIIVEIKENIGERRGWGEGGGSRGPERYLANMRGNGDREISADRFMFLEVVISHDEIPGSFHKRLSRAVS